jgi:hypothetical protein
MSPASDKPADRAAEFVDQIVDDPNNVPDVMRLYGYLGASSEEGHERLYLNPDLQYYVDAPAGAVLNRMAVPKDQDPYGATVLWVRRDAALKYKMGPAAQALANYFAGAIAGAAAAGGVRGQSPVPDYGAVKTWFGCGCSNTYNFWTCAIHCWGGGGGGHSFPACAAQAEFLVGTAACSHYVCVTLQCTYFCHCQVGTAGVFDHAAAAPQAAAYSYMRCTQFGCQNCAPGSVGVHHYAAAGGPAPHSLQCTPDCVTHGCCGHTNLAAQAAGFGAEQPQYVYGTVGICPTGNCWTLGCPNASAVCPNSVRFLCW